MRLAVVHLIPEVSLHCRYLSLSEVEMEMQYALRSEASKWNFDSEPFGWKNFTEVELPEFNEFGAASANWLKAKFIVMARPQGAAPKPDC